MGIDQFHRTGDIRAAQHAQHRTEDLFLVDRHLRGDVVEQGATDEEALLEARHLVAATIDHQGGAFFHATADQSLDALLGGGRHHRAHLGSGVHAFVDLQVAGAVGQGRHQGIAGAAHRHRHRDRHAALAGRAEGCTHQGIHGQLHVGIGHHHHVVLGAAQGLHALALGRATGIDVFGNRGRADEADGLDLGMIQQRIDGDLVTLHDVEDAIGQAGFLQQLGDQQRRRGIALGRLQHEAVATGDGDGEHPHRHHRREVEWRDAGHHAQRLAHRPGIDATGDLVGVFALEHLRDAGGELDDLDAARHFALGIRKGLAMLAHDEAGDVVGPLLDQVQEAEQHPRARQRRRIGPAGEGRHARLDGGIDLFGGAQRHLRHRHAQRRVEDIGIAPALGIDALAADVMCNLFHESFLRCSEGSGQGLEDGRQLAEQLVDLLLVDHQRWRQGDDVAGHADQDAIVEGTHEGVIGAGADAAGNGRQLDAGDQADGAHVDDMRQAAQCVGSVLEVVRDRLCVLQHALGLEHLQRGQASGTSQWVARVGIAVEQLDAIRAVHEGLVDVRLDEHRAHGHHAVGEALGGGDDVRLDIEVVGGEGRSQAAETGDDFIEDQQDAMLGTQLAQALQVTLGRHQHAGGTGHRLDDDGGDVGGIVQGDDAFQLIGQVRAVFGLALGEGVLFQVVGVRQVVHTLQQRGAEGLAVAADAPHRHAAEAHAVIAALASDHAGAGGVAGGAVIGQGDLDGGIHRFRTGAGIEHVGEAVAGIGLEAFGQFEGAGMAQLEGRRIVQRGHRLLHGRHDLGMGVAQRHAPQAGSAVQDGMAGVVAVVHALGRDQHARRGLEVAVGGEGHPVGGQAGGGRMIWAGHGAHHRRMGGENQGGNESA
eukprot:TRINITY_DN427_c0_g3_i1.p1 TRINITY_DN427_c0_g3~~TRINITY_DN427_c0_g3_i1.p1  ORF type:complete len:877 (-),score=398.28 TRINITY_DN427_c0_g3_i1:14792-17422(-)